MHCHQGQQLHQSYGDDDEEDTGKEAPRESFDALWQQKKMATARSAVCVVVMAMVYPVVLPLPHETA